MSSDRIPERLPLFPLPNVALFPGTILPLRVFEPRYVQLVEDAGRADGWLALPQLLPGFERDYEGAPGYYPVSGAGRLTRTERNGDGTYTTQVMGLAVVRLHEMPSERLYRVARPYVLTESPDWLADHAADAALGEMLQRASAMRLLSEEEGALSVPESPARRAALVNRVATRVLAEPGERQEILEARDYRERIALTLRQLRLMANTVAALARLRRPDDPAWN